MLILLCITNSNIKVFFIKNINVIICFITIANDTNKNVIVFYHTLKLLLVKNNKYKFTNQFLKIHFIISNFLFILITIFTTKQNIFVVMTYF